MGRVSTLILFFMILQTNVISLLYYMTPQHEASAVFCPAVFCHCFERMIIFSVVMLPTIRGPSLTTLQEAEIAAAQVRMARGKRSLLTESVPCSVMSWLSPLENRSLPFRSRESGSDIGRFWSTGARTP